MTVHALFFCLRPDPATAARLGGVSDEIAHRLGLRVRPSRAERLHVTLHHLGWYDDRTEEAEAMAEVRRRAASAADALHLAPLRVDFDELLSFRRKPRNLPLVLSGGACLDPVRALHAALGRCLHDAVLSTDPRFTPHLTLFYDNTPVEPQPFFVPGWDATDFHLVDSLQGRSTHVVLGRWPLSSPE